MVKEYQAGEYDVIVIGAGHAGCEAALASARLGMKTCIFTINMDAVGNLPCNPSIGGTAKGHLVREVDALGGEMGRAADDTFLQSRMLNRGKGPAVHSLRAQIDRRKYSTRIKHALELQRHLDLKQAEIIEIRPSDGKFRWNVVTKMEVDMLNRADIVVIGIGTEEGHMQAVVLFHILRHHLRQVNRIVEGLALGRIGVIGIGLVNLLRGNFLGRVTDDTRIDPDIDSGKTLPGHRVPVAHLVTGSPAVGIFGTFTQYG